MIFGKGDQRVTVADANTQLIAYYAGEGWAEVTDGADAPEVAPSAPAGDVPESPSPVVPEPADDEPDEVAGPVPPLPSPAPTAPPGASTQ